MTRLAISLSPLDPLLFRDGRELSTGARIATGLPMPQTLAGALRTWLLQEANCDFLKLGRSLRKGASFADAAADGQPSEVAVVAELRFRGPWLALTQEDDFAVHPLVPVPATLMELTNTNEIVRLDPLRDPNELPGWQPPEKEMLPLWCRDLHPAKRKSGYLTIDGLMQFLHGGTPARDCFISSNQLFDYDKRTGIVINDHSLATEESMIYAADMLALHANVKFYAEIETACESSQKWCEEQTMKRTAITFGGQGRRSIVEKVEAVKWPNMLNNNTQRLSLLLITPAIFNDRWKPQELNPVAAAVPGYQAVSGWDIAHGGPKPNRFAVQAGSVYFLDQPSETIPQWLCGEEDNQLGWGTYLMGEWNYA